MAYTFLQGVNKALKAAAFIQGVSGELSSFTDSARQVDVDVCIAAWNDVIAELRKAATNLKGEATTSTITLATSTREYDLASDFEAMSGDPVDSTNGRILTPYPGGFERMRLDQMIPGNFTGLPSRWCINPTNGKLRVDTTPTSAENGLVYTYLYEKRINLSAISDTFPFSDSVVDALTDAVSQVYRRRRGRGWDEGFYAASMSRGALFAGQKTLRTRYGVSRAAS